MPKRQPTRTKKVKFKKEKCIYESHRRKGLSDRHYPCYRFLTALMKPCPLCKALADGGLPAAEVTFRTACAEECIRKIHEEMPEMLLGAGTVLTTEQADRAMAAGASFIVAPGFDPEVCKHVIDKGGIMMPGTCSAGEMQQAMNMGCEALKFFPAEANGGVGMLKNIGAALKSARWMCTGGVNAKNVNDYLGYDQIFAVGGTWMCKSDVIKAGDWAKITAQRQGSCSTPCWA